MGQKWNVEDLQKIKKKFAEMFVDFKDLWGFWGSFVNFADFCGF
jgi:hypothetical protein